MIDWSQVVNFKPSEFAAPEKMDVDFIYKLDMIRGHCGFPLRINSSWRSEEKQQQEIQKDMGVKHSAHTKVPCKAVDIAVDTSAHRFRLVEVALFMGIKRIGIGKNFIHLDADEENPPEVLWLYE